MFDKKPDPLLIYAKFPEQFHEMQQKLFFLDVTMN